MNIQPIDSPTRAMWHAIAEPLARYNETLAGPSHRMLLVYGLMEADELIGGLWGITSYRHLHIEMLFIPQSLRNKGLGTELLHRAETEAVARGCSAAWIEAYSFGAVEFYQHRGYSAFGQLDDCPPGHARLFLRKTLRGCQSEDASQRKIVQ